jgi:hypothetical protein
VPDADYLLEAAEELRPYIVMMYQRSADRRPVILCDIHEQRVYVYSYGEFKGDLSGTSQALLEQQYEKAVRENKIVVFVRDTERKRLVSFSMDCG